LKRTSRREQRDTCARFEAAGAAKVLQWHRSLCVSRGLRSEIVLCMFLIWHMHCSSRAW
jgi:hypothetical protein